MMKGVFKLWLWVVVLAACCGTVSAQSHHQHITREQLAEAQANHIAQSMAMDDKTAKRFVDTYCQFQRELWALGGNPRSRHHSMDDEETEMALKERFAHSQKILDLRRKYYAIYSEFLTQKQIRRVYQLERQMMDRLYRYGRHGCR